MNKSLVAIFYIITLIGVFVVFSKCINEPKNTFIDNFFHDYELMLINARVKKSSIIVTVLEEDISENWNVYKVQASPKNIQIGYVPDIIAEINDLKIFIFCNDWKFGSFSGIISKNLIENKKELNKLGMYLNLNNRNKYLSNNYDFPQWYIISHKKNKDINVLKNRKDLMKIINK